MCQIHTIMVLKNCGAKGYRGVAEVGNMAIPHKLLKQGGRDIIRISDARMSGTAYGTVVLHVAPEAAAGGPLAPARNGDLITLDVAARVLHLHVDDAEMAALRGLDRTAAASDARLRQAQHLSRAAGQRGGRFRLPRR